MSRSRDHFETSAASGLMTRFYHYLQEQNILIPTSSQSLYQSAKTLFSTTTLFGTPLTTSIMDYLPPFELYLNTLTAEEHVNINKETEKLTTPDLRLRSTTPTSAIDRCLYHFLKNNLLLLAEFLLHIGANPNVLVDDWGHRYANPIPLILYFEHDHSSRDLLLKYGAELNSQTVCVLGVSISPLLESIVKGREFFWARLPLYSQLTTVQAEFAHLPTLITDERCVPHLENWGTVYQLAHFFGGNDLVTSIFNARDNQVIMKETRDKEEWEKQHRYSPPPQQGIYYPHRNIYGIHQAALKNNLYENRTSKDNPIDMLQQLLMSTGDPITSYQRHSSLTTLKDNKERFTSHPTEFIHFLDTLQYQLSDYCGGWNEKIGMYALQLTSWERYLSTHALQAKRIAEPGSRLTASSSSSKRFC